MMMWINFHMAEESIRVLSEIYGPSDDAQPFVDDQPFGRPQPDPKREGQPVTAALLQWLKETKLSLEQQEQIRSVIEQRRQYGLKKYGQELYSNDGRDDVIDAVQELANLLQYSYKAKMNGRVEELLEQLSPLLSALNELLQ